MAVMFVVAASILQLLLAELLLVLLQLVLLTLVELLLLAMLLRLYLERTRDPKYQVRTFRHENASRSFWGMHLVRQVCG